MDQNPRNGRCRDKVIPMVLSSQQKQFLNFVKESHGSQKRKYTGEPYWNHVFRVAELVSHYERGEGIIEIALGHDLIEDTQCTKESLNQKLIELEYTSSVAQRITDGVCDLTDEYIKEAYPQLNRKERKAKEAKRLSSISPTSQSIKYADLIDNVQSIVTYDKGFARVYLDEKSQILKGMREGNKELLKECEKVMKEGYRFL